MDIITEMHLKKEPLSLKDCEGSLIRLLYAEANESYVFAEAKVLLGIGAFEECYDTLEEETANYRELVDSFYKATGKKFLGDFKGDKTKATPEDFAPDPTLPKEAYQEALADVFFGAQAGTVEADDWILFATEKDYEMRLTYAEFLALNSGYNAWNNWLESLIDCDCTDEEYEAFSDKATAYFADRFLALIKVERDITEGN